MMNRSSWSSAKEGRIQLGGRQSSGFDTPMRNIPVKKAVLEDGILHLLATAAEMQQRQDLDSANQLYEAAIAKMKAHGLDRKKFLNGTAKKPAPLSSRTPVEWSIHVGDMRSVITLLGDPNVALAQMVSTLTFEQLEAILDAGASIEHRIGPYGRTLLLREASEGRRKGIEIALDHGASISCLDDNGDTVLALCLRSTGPDTISIFKDLLEAGADINGNDGHGQPMLQVAVAHANPEVVATVIETLSPLTAKHVEQMQDSVANLLFFGNKINSRTCGVILLLLKHGIDPNTSSQATGRQSLFEFALQQDGEVGAALVSGLIEHGAEPSLPAALVRGQPNQLELVLTRLTPLSELNYLHMIEWVQNILSIGKRRSQRDGEILKILLDFGVDPNLRSVKPPHSPLIFFAVESNDLELVEKLIAHKANLTAANDDSETALVRAAKLQNRAVYDALKAGGVNDKYFLGWTVWSSYTNR